MSIHSGSGRRAVQIAVLLALLLVLIAAPGLAQGQEVAALPSPFVAQIDANATVEIPVHGFCLDYGLPFPGASLGIGDLAPDRVRQAITYALGQGYVTTEPWQTQLAVWYFVEGAKVDEEYSAVADELDAPIEPASLRATDNGFEWDIPWSAVGWHNLSSTPGHTGNTVLSGHNYSQGAEFSRSYGCSTSATASRST